MEVERDDSTLYQPTLLTSCQHPSITHPHVRFEEAKEQLRSASETNLMDYEYQATSRTHPPAT